MDYQRQVPAKAGLLLLILFFLLYGWLGSGLAAQENETLAAGPQVSVAGQTSDCAMAVQLLKKQNHKLSRELGEIKREIAALRVSLDNPGPLKIFGGIGYILGLFGAGALVAARKKNAAGPGKPGREKD